MESSSELTEKLQDVKDKVLFYLDLHRFDAAEKLLKATLAEHGPLAHIQNLLGVAYVKQSRFNEAIEAFHASIQKNPRFTEAFLNLSVLLCDLGFYEQAQEVLERMKEQEESSSHPSTAPLPPLVIGRLANKHGELGLLYEQSGLRGEAIQEYRKALQLYPHMPDIRKALGRLYMDVGQWTKAKEEFEIALGFFTENLVENADIRNWLGLAYMKLNLTSEAEEQWNLAYDIVPSNPLSSSLQRLQRL